MGRSRTVKNEDGTFSTACPACGKVRFLKSNPCKKRNCSCPSCLRKGKSVNRFFILPIDFIKRYLSGESANMLSIELGITPKTFITALKRQEIKPRTMSEAITIAGCVDNANKISDELRATGEMSIRISAGRQGVEQSEWVEFRKTYWDRIRATKEWADWRKAVYERDCYMCVLCGKKGGGKTRLSPHHIKRKVDFPELIFNVENGVTLCHSCHCLVNQREAKYEEQFYQYIALDRDHNAALNILTRGLASLGNQSLEAHRLSPGE